MQLISAHIQNFGKFHDADFSFNAGLNSFLHENGWGKTTLSVFIKSMLYGLKNSTKKNIDENENQKYTPWQGGIFGGNLVFEHNGKKYRITRTFGKKKNDDTFELIDLATNKNSSDYTENLGEEIYGVSRETYERSVHVALSETPAGSPEISAKLNNLIEADDIGNFDNAYNALVEKAKSLKPLKGTNGKIPILQAKIDTDREILSDIQSKMYQNEELSKLIEETIKKFESLKREQNEITEQLAISAKYEGKIRWEQLKSDATLAENQKTKIEESFNGDIPTAEQISSCNSAYQKLTTFKQNEAGLKLTSEEKEEYNNLQKKFSSKDVSDEKISTYISDVSAVQGASAEIAKLESEKQTIENEIKILQLNKPKNIKRIVLLSVAGIFLISGLAGFFILKNFFVGLAGLVVALGSFIAAVLCKPKKVDCSEQETKLLEIKSKIAAMSGEAAKKESGFKNFIASIIPGATLDLTTATTILSNINLDFNRYSALEKKQTVYNSWLAAQSEMPETLENEVKSFLKHYCKTDDISSIFTETNILNGKLSDLKNAETALASSREKLQKFEADPKNDVENFATLEKPKKSVDELNSELAVVTDKLNALAQETASHQKKFDDNLTFTEKKEDTESEIENLSIEKKEKEAEYDLLIKTRDLLAKAKENLDANYSDPMKEGFEKYMKLLTDATSKSDAKKSPKLSIDTDLKVSVEGESGLYESGYLSEGYKDMVNFCSRMALIDAIFKEAKPAVILDDPFVNLDDDKVPNALNLVKKMSEKNQILYFCCHKSRALS